MFFPPFPFSFLLGFSSFGVPTIIGLVFFRLRYVLHLFVFVHPQQIWLIHILTDEQLPNAPARGTTICGRTVAFSKMIGNKILGLSNLLLLLESERSWSSLTLNKFVHL